MKFNEAVEQYLVEGPKDKLVKDIAKIYLKGKSPDSDFYKVIDDKISAVYDYLAENGHPTSGKFFDGLIMSIATGVKKSKSDAMKAVVGFAKKNKIENENDWADDVLEAWYAV